MYVRDFQDGCVVAQPLLVRSVAIQRRSEGPEYLKLMLGDRTGTVPAVVWEELDHVHRVAEAGTVVHVRGRFSHHERFGAQLTVDAVREAAEHEYDRAELIDGPAAPRSRWRPTFAV